MINKIKAAACSLLILGSQHVSASNSNAEIIMNWAESEYASYFPSHQATQTSDPWTFRFYSDTGTYLGVNDANEVYVMGGSFGDAPQKVGDTTTFLGVMRDSAVPIETYVPEISLVNAQLKTSTSLAYSEYSPSGSDAKYIKLYPQLDEEITRISSTLTFNEESSVTGGAQIGSELRLYYLQPDDNVLMAVLRLRKRDDEKVMPVVQAFLLRCLDADCTSDVYYDEGEGDLANYSELSSDENNISIEWQAENEQFVFTVNGVSIAMTKAGFDAFEDAVNNNVILNTDTFNQAQIRTRVTRINEEGDSGNISISYDDIMLNGSLHDDFSSEMLDINKWKASY